MNAFQILDKDNNPIKMNDLDREVCEITGNEYDPKKYCRLGSRKDYPETFEGDLDFSFNTYNWFDTIGWQIAQGMSFEEIIEAYKEPVKKFLGKTGTDGKIITFEKIYPYHSKVLYSWIEKGYQPKSIKQ